MIEQTDTGSGPAPPLDPRLRDLLRELPQAQATVVDALVRERDRHVILAERRAERLQRLHEVSVSLTRSLERAEVERQLARHAVRMLRCTGAVVAEPDSSGGVEVILHWKEGSEAPLDGAVVAAGAIADVSRSSRSSRAEEPPAAPHVLAVPVTVGYRLAAILAVYGLAPFSLEDEDLLHTLGATAATALVNASLFAESLHEKRQSEALASVANALGSSLRISEVLRLSLRHSMALLGAEGAIIGLKRDVYLHLVATEGIADRVQGFYVPVTGSATGRAMLEQRTLIVNDASVVEGGYERARDAAGIERMVAAPLLTPEGPIGTLAVVNRATPFTERDARDLERLASQLSLALTNARLYEEASDATRELGAAFDAIAGGMAVLDGDGFILRHNGRLAAIAGHPDGTSLVGRALWEVLLRTPRAVTEDDPLGAAIIRRTTGRDIVVAEWNNVSLQVVASPHPAGGAVVTVDDITAERARDEALVRAEARYERLVESAEDSICTFDPEGRLTHANRALERVLGRPRAKLIGLRFTELLSPAEQAEKEVMFRATLAGKHQRGELRFTPESGRVRVATVVTAPLYEDGAVRGVLAIVRDVTDERALMEKVVRSEKLVALGELVGGVAHEVNSPLTSILAFGQLLQSGACDAEESEKALSSIVNEAKRAARIVGKFLTFARQHPTEKTQTDVNQVLLDTIELRRYPLKMQAVTVTTDLAPDMRLTWADPLQLQQVFINLLNNAEQALSARASERSIRVQSRLARGEIRVTIADNGPGIAAEHLPHIFNPFYTTKARGVGTGLGLSISFGIVRDHGGSLAVHSDLGRGATFEVVLPVTAPPAASAS